MKNFEWNKNGICKNPNSYLLKKQWAYEIRIRTAQTAGGKWCYGYSIRTEYLSYRGGGSGASNKRAEYDTELDAKRAAGKFIRNEYFNRDHQHDRSATQEINEFISPQLKLF